MISLRRLVHPAVEPVSLTELKIQARVEHNEENALLESYIRAAREHVENMTGRALITQTLRMSLDHFPQEIELRRPPIVPEASPSHVTVRYWSPTGDLVTLDPAFYHVLTDAEPGRVVLAEGDLWPVTQRRAAAVQVTYDAGYGDDPQDVPEPLRQAILLLGAHWVDQRAPVTIGSVAALDVPFTVDALLAPFRMLYVH